MLEQNLVQLAAKQQDKASTVLLGEEEHVKLMSPQMTFSLSLVLGILPFMFICPSIYLHLKRSLDTHGIGLKTLLQPVCNGISNCIVQLVPFY